MKLKKLLFILSCIFFCTSVYSQEIEELTGDIIYYDKCNEKNNSVRNAFDGNIDTYFNSCGQFGNWIGLDLGEKHVITRIAYAPRMDSGYRERLQLGIFEGANTPDFGDAIALFIIPGLTGQELIEQKINCTRAFRYVRFVFPTPQQSGKSSYISELKFYGYKSEGNDEHLPQLTNLPTISIHTVNNQDITSKEQYVKGIVSVVYADGKKFYSDSLEMRGRGNNSWTHPKKPYRLKLAKSTRFMDQPAKARNWTLINNYGDKTLMRNMIAFDFSHRLQMPYTSVAEAVDVVLNGDYKGCYQLCDHIDVRKNRVDIEEMTADDLTGGYMIEIDAYAYPNEPKKFTSDKYRIPVTIKYPKDDEITFSQEKFIEKHFNKFTDAVYGQKKDSIEKYLDLETFLRHFLVGEYAGNTDTYWSVRMTKKRDDDKFYFGPVWDFDLGFENDHRTYPINQNAWNTNQWVCLTGGSSGAGDTKSLVSRLISDYEYNERLKKTYAYYRDRNIISKDILQTLVDGFAEKLDLSQQLNFKRWRIMNTTVHENPVIHGSYEAEVANVKKYISERIDWMDYKLAYVPNPVPEPITIRFHKPESWKQVYVRAWIPGGEGNITGTHKYGSAMNSEGNGWYSYTFSEGYENISLMFNDNDAIQTSTVAGIYADDCYATTGEWESGGKYGVDIADCITGMSKEPIFVTMEQMLYASQVQVYAKDNSVSITNVLGNLSVDIVNVTGQTVMSNIRISDDTSIPLGKGNYLLVVTDEAMHSCTYKCIIP